MHNHTISNIFISVTQEVDLAQTVEVVPVLAVVVRGQKGQGHPHQRSAHEQSLEMMRRRTEISTLLYI